MTLLEDLLRTLLEISLPMTAVVALLLLLRPLLQKHYRAKWMYWVWLLLAVRLVVPVNFALPRAPIVVAAPSASVYRHETVRTNPGYTDYVILTPKERAQATAREAAIVKAGEGVVSPNIRNYYVPVLTLTQIAALVWLTGFYAVLLWEGVSYVRFRRRVRRWQSPLEHARFEALKAEIGVTHLTLAQCSAISSPMVTGFVHPKLLLPEADAPEAVLRHELVHAKRRDLWYKLLLVLVRAVHWFNPLVWLMTRQASQDLELSCDEAVVAGRDEGFRAGYGKAILDAVNCGGGKENAPLTTYFHGGKRAMLERLQSIINTRAKRRGAIALGLALVLTVSASALCAISPPVQAIDGGIYTLNIPADVTATLVEKMPDEHFPTSYYSLSFNRYLGSGSVTRQHIPNYEQMSFEERAATLQPADAALGPFEFTSYISPGGLEGILGVGQGGYEFYTLSLGGDEVLNLRFYLGHDAPERPVTRFTHAEIDAMLASLMIGDATTPNSPGNLTLSNLFVGDESIWYLWDTAGPNPKLLGTASLPAEYRIWAAPLWSEDGKWAAVPSGDGSLKKNYRIFGVGKEGFEQNFPVTLDAMLSQDYTPVPDSMELQAMKFVDSYGNYPTLALSYSLLDTEGNLQSGTLNYDCTPRWASAGTADHTSVTNLVQNTPLVPTVWQEGGHSFSLPLTKGTTVSSVDTEGAHTFTGPNGEYLGRIYKVEKADAWNQAYRVGDQTHFYAWLDETGDRCYQLELCDTDLPLYTSNRIIEGLTMDGDAVDFYYENQIAK